MEFLGVCIFRRNLEDTRDVYKYIYYISIIYNIILERHVLVVAGICLFHIDKVMIDPFIKCIIQQLTIGFNSINQYYSQYNDHYIPSGKLLHSY